MNAPLPCSLAGIVLAAGFSRRMGRDKLTLPLPVSRAPLVSAPLQAAYEAGLFPLLAVVHPEADPDLVCALRKRATLVNAPLARLGQAESLKAGLRALLKLAPTCTGAMIVLGDQPLITAPLLRALTETFVRENGSCAVAPQCEGVRGNPVILPRRAFKTVLALEGDAGARRILNDYDLRLVETGDRATLYDVDTPAAYESFCMKNIPAREYSRSFPWLLPLPRLYLTPDTEEGFAQCGDIPNDAVCFQWCAQHGIMDHIQTHCLRVADFAEGMARRALEVRQPHLTAQAPPSLLPALTRAAGLLHDIAKSYTIRHGGSHAQIGASWVIAHTGNRLLGQTVLHHVEWPWELPHNVCLPVFFVNYADRRVRHETYVSMDERYDDLLERYGTTVESRTRITAGWEQAKNLERALSAQLELPIHACTFAGGRLVE